MKKFIAATMAIASVFSAAPAHAILGADEKSLDLVKTLIVSHDENISTTPTHTIHEYAVKRGVIRAYVSPSGQVFAYTGNHQMGHPPTEIFGPYLQEYREALAQSRKKYGRRPLFLNTEHLKFGMSGPQGSLHWYLILQDLPQGVSSDDIR